MSERINIAELLKDCPRGMELDSPVWDNIVFDGLEEGDIVILRKRIGKRVYLTQYGAVNDIDGKCVIFPKGKPFWGGFGRRVEFKNGDVVATNSGIWIGIVTGGISGQWCPTYCAVNCEGSFAAFLDGREPFIFERPATEDEKASLFNAIENSGFVWNAEAKRLEKAKKLTFKDGDVVATKDGSLIGITAGGKNNEEIPTYCVVNEEGMFMAFPNCEETYTFERLALPKENEKLFDAIKEHGYVWDFKHNKLNKRIEQVFKDGDVVSSEDGMWLAITAGGISTDLVPAYCLLTTLNNNNLDIYETNRCFRFDRLATEAERKKLRKAIEDAGFHWNAEEKRFEKIEEHKLEFKDGDIVATDSSNWIGITAGGKGGTFIPTYCVLTERKELRVYPEYRGEWLFNRFATIPEKEELFGALGAAGYVWNDKEKRLEGRCVPEFEDGDVVAFDTNRGVRLFIYKEHLSPGLARCHMMLDCDGTLDIYPGNYFVSRHATEEEKKKLFKAITDNGLIWNAEEKRVENMTESKKFDPSSLKPFDKVLVRTYNSDIWECDFFSSYSAERSNKFHLIGAWRDICIPFEGNEHLLGTTDDCADFYKTWED